MFQKKFVGCISLSRLRVAAAALPILLVFSPIHDKYTILNPHVSGRAFTPNELTAVQIIQITKGVAR
jgi:hypothetical protein